MTFTFLLTRIYAEIELIYIRLRKLFADCIRRPLSIEDVLVLRVMESIRYIINTCPFKYLLVQIPIELPNRPDSYIKYIIKNGVMYVDPDDIMSSKVHKDIDLDRYCYKFRGTYNSFIDLEHYQFFYRNRDLIRKSFIDAVKTKKSIYDI